MKILFVKEIEGAGAHKIDLINEGSGDAAVESVFVDVPSGDTVSLKGCVKDADGAVAKDIALIDLKSLQVNNAATVAGIYVADATGLSSIELTVTGSDPIVVKALY